MDWVFDMGEGRFYVVGGESELLLREIRWVTRVMGDFLGWVENMSHREV